MNDKSVSVIIPAYNAESSLSRCIESALSQDSDPAEVIVINDGSTDSTAEVAKSFGNSITYLEQENAGQGAARNAGLRVATGRFIAFLDADDYWLPEFVGVCVDFLLRHKEAVAVNTGKIVKLWGGDVMYWPPIPNSKEETVFKPCVLNDFFDFWAKYDHVKTGTVMIRREVIEKAGYQRADLRISQDLEYWGYLATFGEWGFVPNHLLIDDSRSVAAQQGWVEKYKKRRSLCPSVKQWQDRVIPILREEDWDNFCIVRGRVAGGFALNKILGGNDESAKSIVANYGNQMPPNWSTNLMRQGLRAGTLGWKAVCTFIRLRELLKSSFLYAFPKSSGNIISLLNKLKSS